MGVKVIPRSGSFANYEFLIELDAVVFRFVFKYNSRESVWYLDILDELQNELRTGIKLVVNYPLLARWRDITRPAGELIANDPRVNPAPPVLAELGSTILLTYIEGAA